LSQKTSNVKKLSVYDYDGLTDGIFRLIRKDTYVENSTLIEKYDRVMVSLSMAKATKTIVPSYIA